MVELDHLHRRRCRTTRAKLIGRGHLQVDDGLFDKHLHSMPHRAYRLRGSRTIGDTVGAARRLAVSQRIWSIPGRRAGTARRPARGGTVSGFTLAYVGPDGTQQQADLVTAADLALEHALPVRCFPSYRGQRNYPGLRCSRQLRRPALRPAGGMSWWVATTWCCWQRALAVGLPASRYHLRLTAEALLGRLPSPARSLPAPARLGTRSRRCCALATGSGSTARCAPWSGCRAPRCDWSTRPARPRSCCWLTCSAHQGPSCVGAAHLGGRDRAAAWRHG